jgi:hypothetical protein
VLGADDGVGAWPVVDHDRHAEDLREAGGELAGECVVAGAGSVGDHDTDGSFRERALRKGGRGESREASEHSQRAPSADGLFNLAGATDECGYEHWLSSQLCVYTYEYTNMR